MEKAVSRYSSLFTLPSYHRILLLVCIQCLLSGIAVHLFFEQSLQGLSIGLAWGIVLLMTTLLGNYFTVKLFLRNDLILDERRCTFLSVVSNLILILSTLIPSIALGFAGDLTIWFKVFAFGVFGAFSLRSMVFYTISFSSKLKTTISIILQPVLFSTVLLADLLTKNLFRANLILYPALGILLSFLTIYVLTSLLSNLGSTTVGISSLKMFRSFLANWAEDYEGPLERILEILSEEQEIQVSILAFKTQNRMKAVIVVPTIHPGPFKNIGSSAIPGIIQETLEKKFGCVISVPHGISGHELDLASQSENEKVLKQLVGIGDFKDFNPNATPFIRAENNGVKASCQVFGDCALITLTLAPKTMEDLPIELNDIIVNHAKNIGLKCAIPVDAHNSLQGSFNPQEALLPASRVASSALDKVKNLQMSQMQVGSAKIIPPEFSLEDGMGPGGITVLIIKVNDKLAAYVTIDGNNMVTGLRERITSILREIGIDDCEVLTTDTHVVNAIVMTKRGYHPVGEKTDNTVLIKHIKNAVKEAIKNMENAESAWKQVRINGVKVIGEEQIQRLSSLVDKGMKCTKKYSSIIFPLSTVTLLLLLVLL